MQKWLIVLTTSFIFSSVYASDLYRDCQKRPSLGEKIYILAKAVETGEYRNLSTSNICIVTRNDGELKEVRFIKLTDKKGNVLNTISDRVEAIATKYNINSVSDSVSDIDGYSLARGVLIVKAYKAAVVRSADFDTYEGGTIILNYLNHLYVSPWRTNDRHETHFDLVYQNDRWYFKTKTNKIIRKFRFHRPKSRGVEYILAEYVENKRVKTERLPRIN